MKPHFLRALAVGCALHIAASACFCQDTLPSHLARVQRSPASLPAVDKPSAPAGFRLPGEFESHRALLLGTTFLTSDAPVVFSELVRATQETTRVVALVNDLADLTAAQNALVANGLSPNCVTYLPVPHNTMWVRDYAPLVLVGPEDQTILIDAAYDEANRPADDHVPQVLAEQWNLPLLSTALKLDGGNLLSNGEGIVVATTSLIQCNVELGWSKREIYERLLGVTGAKQIVFVEPLAGEPTTHVDMFAAFVSPNTIVVGSYGRDDEENAELLDRNAKLLGEVETSSGPLRVVRVAMPSHDDGVWRTHTNVVFANHVLLVPTYPERDHKHLEQVLNVYRQLLPTRRVIAIDAERISASGGSLHCITMNLGPIDDFPMLPIPDAVQAETTSSNILVVPSR